MADPSDVPFGSNAVRLTPRQWVFAGLVLLGVFAFTPTLWERAEPFDPGPDYRMPYDLSNDYWLFSRYARAAAARGQTLVIGDSVIWGQYVAQDQTLTHYLNERAGEPRFANLGVDGTHPAALAGLLEYYGEAISGRNVLLHCNLLWTASKKHDFQTDKEFRFNHPSLVPQFSPRIPCYRESDSRRLGIVIERNVAFCAWANHLRLAYFDKLDLPNWTLEHPYRSPAKAITLKLPETDGHTPQDAVPWTERGIRKQHFAWVELDTSFQWSCFQRAVETLRRRGNHVFVLVGPFNEHMLDDESLAAYGERRRQVGAWLRDQGIPHYVAPPLPSEYYADASHPISQGYALLAERLFGVLEWK